MSPQDWQRAKDVLSLVAELPGSERARVVEAQFPDEPTLRSELLSILEAHDKIASGSGAVAAGSTSSAAVADLSLPVSADPPIAVGEQYGPYRVVQPLGAGGMGQVFLAEDVRLGRRVALKGLAGRWLKSPTSRQRLLREARAAAALSHPNIATLYDVLEDERRCLLVMEYVEGRTIAALIGDGAIPLGHALRLAMQIADAVVYAHDHGILHCDLKPSNVQVSRDGTAKVLDFGLAHARYHVYEFDADASTSHGLLVGTPPYMPPDRLLTGSLNTAGDIYSLGVTVFEMVTGRRPFDEPNLAALTGAILGASAPVPSSLIPGCPPRLDAAIARAMEREPKRRYHTMREMGLELRAVLKDIDTASQPIPPEMISGSAHVPLSDMVVQQHSRALFWIAAAVVTAGVVTAFLTVLGLITYAFYSAVLGLSIADEGESPTVWPIWGLRSIILPIAQIGVVVLALALLRETPRLLFAIVPAARRWSDPLTGLVRRLSDRIASIPTSAVVSILVIAQVVTLLLVWWRFTDLLNGINNFVTGSGDLTALGPTQAGDHRLYRRLLSLVVFGFGLSWYWLLRSRFAGRRIPPTTIAAATMVILTAIFLLTIPYRMLYQGDGERVSYQTRTCYLVAQKANEGRLFCPLDTPRVQVVRMDDPALKRSGTTESIFTALGDVRQTSRGR